MRIQAAVTRARHAPMSLETLTLEEPRDDEILVKLVATGICHTDIAMRDQAFPVPQPIVLGHEGAGIVERVGKAVRKVVPGDHILMTFNSCGHCPSCDHDAPTYCHEFFGYNFGGSRPDGTSPLSKDNEPIHGNFFGQSSFATHALCHEANVVRVRKDVPLEGLAPLACGVQTGAGAIINVLRPGPGDSLAVFGTGSVGLSAIMAARLIGVSTIIGIDHNESRLTLARDLGATHTVYAKTDVGQAIKDITGFGVDFSFDTTGNAKVIRLAVDCLAPRGTCGIVGASDVGTEITFDALHVMTGGRTLRGIVEGESQVDVFIPALIDLFVQGRFPFDKLITFYPFERINDAMRDSEAGTVVKPVVRFS
ncbi:aryl-alcohol dehydrogenase [Rhizobiales bacterium GAS188]|nr:aryl-alcohol dehydrogenase [Rhizobiales bacterium GAS188]